MERKNTMRRIVAVACVLALVLALVFASTAPKKVEAPVHSEQSEKAVLDGTKAKMIPARSADYGAALLSSVNIQDAVSKNDTHSLIAYYLANNADYYRENGLKENFAFFNADKYLKYNPDVAKAVDNSREGALEHYLTVGALEGRACCTGFDPIIAITLIPEAGRLTPEEVLELWKQTMGNDTTSEYVLYVYPSKGDAAKYVAVKKIPTGSVGGDSGSPAHAPVDPTFTMMLYLCGTDLESRPTHFDATRTLMKLILGAYVDENVNVLILAGGTDSWKNDYLNDLLGVNPGEANKSAIFSVNKANVKVVVDDIIKKIDGVNSVEELNTYIGDIKNNWDTTYQLINQIISKDTLTQQSDVTTAKMGEVSTLVSLLEMAKTEEFKAGSYGLSLWNHGGGALEGVCFPDDDSSNPLEIYEIRDALKAADFGATLSDSTYKLGLLAFDACLMAGTETAAYLSDYYDIMYASEEKTYGDIDYFAVMNKANKKAGEDFLGYYLAIEIVRDRVLNYKGTEDMLSTGALFESGKSANALAELNNVAAQLNELTADSEDAQIIYSAFKNARLKCEQIGSSTMRTSSKDYVDMKNFLQTFKAELAAANVLDAKPELGAGIDKAVEAANQATFATLFNYAGQIIYLNFQDIEEAWLDKEFWSQIKGENVELSGGSIYVPYYGVDKETLASDLKYFESNYADNLSIKDYNTFITKFSNDYLNSDAEKERISKLTEALMKGVDEDGTAVTGYAGMLDMSFKPTTGGEVLTVKVEDYAEGTASQYSSGDAYIDLCDTMDTMLVYITRRADAFYAKNDETMSDKVSIDIVVGSKTVSYENLNGMKSEVNVFTKQFDGVDLNVVSSTATAEDGSTLYDFVVPSDLEGYTQKTDMIEKILGEKDPNASYLTVKGTAKLAVSGEYVVAYHLFESAPEDSGKKYIYRGSTQVLPDRGIFVVDEKLDTESITFYHQTVDGATHKLGYAEEFEWVENSANCSILSLCGGKEYVTNSEIFISGLGLSSIGDSSNSGYYFAVSQKHTTNDDDVFANANAKGEDYDTSTDVFDAITEAKTQNAAAAAEPAPEAEKSAEATEAEIEETEKTEEEAAEEPAEELEEAAEAEETAAEPAEAVEEVTEETAEETEAVEEAMTEEAAEEAAEEIAEAEAAEEPEKAEAAEESEEAAEEGAEEAEPAA